ncbi:MAG: nucleotide pyrophosphohydrolase [Myxococcota bacterium]
MSETPRDRTLHELQAAVHGWISQWEDGYWSPLSNLARLTEEVGELARGINHHHGDKPPKPGEEMGSVAEELADVLFVLITLANSLDIDLTEAFAAVMQKYDIRDAESGRFRRRE